MFAQTIQILRANPQLSVNSLFPLRSEILWRHYIQGRCVTTICISCYRSLSEKVTTAYVIDILYHMFTIQRLPTRSKTFFPIRHAHA